MTYTKSVLGIKCVSFFCENLVPKIFALLDSSVGYAGDVRKSVSRLYVKRSLFFVLF